MTADSSYQTKPSSVHAYPDGREAGCGNSDGVGTRRHCNVERVQFRCKPTLCVVLRTSSPSLQPH
jgi:hypothetical protein